MKNMQKANVVMLSVGEQQYPQDYLAEVIAGLEKEVKNGLQCYWLFYRNEFRRRRKGSFRACRNSS